ncbi:MAG: trypsin-like peptidase domain-containing protein, partial [Rubrivivax sp.]
MSLIDPLLLAATRIGTFNGTQALTNATGFFFARDGRLWLVTSRHVFYDLASNHHPDRIELEIHTHAEDLGQSIGFSVPLYGAGGVGLWHAAQDLGGDVDVAVIELDRSAMPEHTQLRAFGPEHLQLDLSGVPVGQAVLILGFPLGFHDTLHHLPVVRQSIVASAFGLRFQGHGYFLTDGRTHRGTSGAAVVMRTGAPEALPWKLLGVHSARMDLATRDREQDESLGLNMAWYADVLMALTAAPTLVPAGP